ncbi:ABC transporter permease [Govanella unica]|uniref:ABC transporter permease n=1 Tax=Govanella unica TaxID=2975056 RepID=A0A9X3TZ25_9PROT|nr:ABC transporter permease [Govania unica]MDA5194365.1 ABC transporter permease [Govania unica]
MNWQRIAIFALTFLGLILWVTMPLVILVAGAGFCVWLATTQNGRQTVALTRIGLSTLPERLGATMVIIVGIAGVVGVLIALLAMAEGFQATLRQAGEDDVAIVMRKGANAELSSSIDRSTVNVVRQAAGVLHDADDLPIASAEVVVVSNIPKRTTGSDANVELRGVGPEVWKLRPNARITAGRAFKPGLRELVVGQGALGQFSGLDIGSNLLLNNQLWTVVGSFTTGDAHESELWGDVESVAAAYRRTSFQAVSLRLTGPEAFAGLKERLESDPRIKVDVMTTRDYYSKQSQQMTKIIRAIGIGVAIIMAIGAMFGALNTMYAAVAARAREIAMMRALGFQNLPVVLSALLEAMLLALLGGALGALIAYVIFNNYSVSTLGGNFTQVVFQFRVTGGLMFGGLQWALAIGFLGGLFPALRAATVPVTVALREL